LIYAIAHLVVIFISGAIALLISNYFFDESNRTFKSAVTLLLFFGGMAFGRQSIETLLAPSADEVFQQEALFVEVKKKYPNDYQNMVNKAQRMIDTKSLNVEQSLGLGRQYLQPLLVKRLAKVDDKLRSNYVQATVKQMQILRQEGQGECFSLISGKGMESIDLAFLRRSAQQSGIAAEVLKLFQAEGFHKAIVSERRMQETIKDLQKYLFRKYKKDVGLLESPDKVFMMEDKQKVCDMTIDLYNYLNQPNDKAKMATLRKMLTAATLS